MGKPLSKPDCLGEHRVGSCLSKKEDDDDGYIEDCYVPQRSIYDTVRINEQIDCGSSASLLSRQLAERLLLPVSQRSLEQPTGTISSNGSLGTNAITVSVASGSASSREIRRLDEKAIFDALKLSGPIGGCPETAAAMRPQMSCSSERRDNCQRRSWKVFSPREIMEVDAYITAELGKFNSTPKPRASAPELPFCTKDTDGPADELAESMPKYNEESQGCGVGNELHEQVMRTFCGSGSSLDVYSDNVYDEVFSTEAEGGELKMGIDKTVQVKSECILSDDSETIHHQTENCSCDMETAACMHACINGEFSFLPLEEGAIDTGCQEDVQDNSTPAGEENFQPEHKVVLELRKELEETEKIFPAVVELGTLIITDSVSPKTNCLTVTQNVESSDSKCAEEDPRLEFGLFLSGNECAVERLQIENNGKSQKWEQKDEGSLEVHVDNLTEQREVEEEFVFVEHTTSCGEIEDSLTVNVDNMGPEELDIDSFLDSRLPSESYISSDHASSSAEVSSITDGPSDLADDSMTDTEPSDIGFNDYTITDFTSTRFGHEALELDLLGGYESCPDDLEVLDTEALLQEAPDIMPGHDQLLTDVTTEGDSFENDKKVLAFQKGKVEALQTAVQAVNWQGQALVQSAPPTADTHNLETSLEDVNTRWNSLNRQVAERAAKLQEALLHCGKFYEALESLLSWLADTEELVAGQKPPSAEYKVVRAQLQEQKLLQRVLEGNRVRVEALRSEGELIAEQTSEPVERQRVLGALESLDHRWQALIDKADARRRQLEAILTLAKQFHDTLQPLSDWMVGLERRLAMVEPVDTRSPVIQEQIKQLKALQEEIAKQAGSLERAQGFAGSLLSLTSLQAGAQAQTNLETFRARYLEMSNRVARRAVLLEIALDNAQIFGRDEVALLTWLAELREALSLATVEDYQTAVLQGQFHQQMALQEEITSRKPDVDQAVKKGQALLKQSTGDDTLLVQEKLEGLRAQYVELVATSNHATRSLEEALQLATHFEAAHGELDDALGSLEAGLYDYDEAEACGVEPTSLLQNRQQALRQGVMDGHVLLDTVNEVGRALLQLVPWRARERLDQQMAEAGERFRAVRYAVEQRAERVDAAIQRSQQFEQAVLAERAWAAEMSRKLDTLGEISLEQDQMSSQLRVQKAFTLDVLRHKETMEELVVNAPNVLASCNDEEKDRQQSQLEVLNQEFDSVNRSNSERQQRLERAQGLLGQFWESYEELCPWLDETETTLAILPAPAMEPDALRLQQDELRLLRESVAEHKPHIDRLAKTGPMLAELSAREGLVLADQATNVRQRYMAFRTEMQHRAIALDEAEELATQFHDKINPMIESLERVVERLREPPPTPAEVEKIRDQILETCAVTAELEKLQPSFMALRSRGEEIVARSEHTTSSDNSAARAVQKCLDHLAFLWSDIEARAEEREAHLLDVLDVAERFWPDLTALLTTLRDTFDCIRDLDEPGLDPSVIKQQTEVTQSFREEIDTLLDELETLRATGDDLMSACGEPDKPDVKKSIDEVNVLWDLLNKAWQDRMEHLEEAMQTTIQFQDMLQNIFDWLDSSEAQLVAMSPVGTELNTVKEQMVELKAFKEETYQQQIEMEKLSHQGEVLHRKAEGTANRDMLEAPLRELRRQWAVLDSKIITRQHKLESSLLALGQFQHALEELLSWLSHTEDLLAEQKPIREDPKEIEIELAKHHVLRNDVLAHKATLENVAQAGGELVQLGDGDVAGSVLRQKLNRLQKRWEDLLKETELRQKKLESALNQAQGFQGEIHALLAWLGKVEAQLLLSRPFGGLPETSRDQLNAHLELCADLDKREPTYLSLMERGVDVLSAGKTSSSTNTAQVLHSLEQRWQNVCAKAAERRVKLEDAVSMATEFHNNLQDFINWLTHAEHMLNSASPPSLILETILFQLDEHKVFVMELNGRRDNLLQLDRTGSQLKVLAQKQDVALVKNLLLSVQARWEKVGQRSVERGRALEETCKKAKQFHELWSTLIGWLEEAERGLDSELDIANDPEKIKVQLGKHKEFQKALGGKQPLYDSAGRMGRTMKGRTEASDDREKLEDIMSELRDHWDTVCGKSVERQHKLEEALLFSGQFTEALQALVDWLTHVEPQLAEDLPVHGDLDLVLNLIDSHKVFQKELGKKSSSVQALRRLARELAEGSRDDTGWLKSQMAELVARWEIVCRLSISKQVRLESALKQAEVFHTAVHSLLEWLAEAEQTLRFHGVLPDDEEALCGLMEQHQTFMKKLEERLADLNHATTMGESILAVSHPDAITNVKHWLTIIRARFEEVMAWAKQHQQRLEAFLAELLTNAQLMDCLLGWLQRAEETLCQRDLQPMPEELEDVKALIIEHQTFMEEMTQKQPDVDKLTKTFKRKPANEQSSSTTQIPLFDRGRVKKRSGTSAPTPGPGPVPLEMQNPRVNLLFNKWRQVWLMAWDRQRKLQDELDHLTELKEFANFDFDVWRKHYMRWMNHKKSRVMDFFRRIDKDQDGKITRQEFIEGILSSKFPTNRLEMSAVADEFDKDGDGCMDYYEFVAALHPNKDAYRPLTDADKIEDEVTRQVSKCRCPKRFQVEQIGDNKYRFGDSQQLRLVRILRSTVMVRVGGGWMALDEFLVKNDPCRARGRTNLELREKFILGEGMSQSMAPFKSKGRRSRPNSRPTSPTRTATSPSYSSYATAIATTATVNSPGNNNNSVTTASAPSSPAITNGNKSTPVHASKLKQPGFITESLKKSSRPPSRAGSQAGSRPGSHASSRRGSDASDMDVSDMLSHYSETTETSVDARSIGRLTTRSNARAPGKPSKIPTPSKASKNNSTPIRGNLKR